MPKAFYRQVYNSKRLATSADTIISGKDKAVHPEDFVFVNQAFQADSHFTMVCIGPYLSREARKPVFGVSDQF